MNKTDKLIDWLVGDTEDFSILEDMPVVPMPEIAPKNELQEGSCTCSDCDNSMLCEHSEEEPHESVKGCSSCAR